MNGEVHHILCGSFRSLSLFLLAFSPLNRTLELVQTVDGFGPHQYLATSPHKDRIYTTSWALPPVLSSWSFEHKTVHHLNNVPITATSSYITIPPPFTHAYSVGGPTGEVHALDLKSGELTSTCSVHALNPKSGAFSYKLQQLLFVPEHQLQYADKTRAALRHGSHAVEFSPSGDAFIPVLGTSSIEIYTRNTSTNLLTHKSTVPSPRGPHTHDGPRHIKVHPNGHILYSITEHTNLIDAYQITSTGLTHLSSRSILPSPLNPSSFRGDTLCLSPSTPTHPAPLALFATTRGSKPSTPGWLTTFRLDRDGMFVDAPPEYWQTPTSGGKANALDVVSKDGGEGEGEGVWIVLTDDDQDAPAGVWVLQWDGWATGGVRSVAGWPPPGESDSMQGGSHAVWLD